MNKQKITNGILLIVAGVFFLLLSLGLLQRDIFRVAINLWPVILILVGLNIMINKEWFKWIGILIYAVVVLGVYFYNPHLVFMTNSYLLYM